MLVHVIQQDINSYCVFSFYCTAGVFCSALLGSVPTDKRQSMVDNFNRPSDPRFLFLLSSKAGGVGINL